MSASRFAKDPGFSIEEADLSFATTEDPATQIHHLGLEPSWAQLMKERYERELRQKDHALRQREAAIRGFEAHHGRAMRDLMQSHQIELQKISAALESKTRQLQEAHARMGQDLVVLKRVLSETQAERDTARAAVRSRDDAIQAARGILDSLERRLQQQTEVRDQAEARHAQELARMRSLVELERQRSARVEQKLKEQLEEKSKAVAKAPAANEQQQAIPRERIAGIASELRQSGGRHPLADYLDLTRNQLSEVEQEVRMLPDGSHRRTGLEQSARSLLKQKNTLENMVQATGEHFSRLADELEALVRTPGASGS